MFKTSQYKFAFKYLLLISTFTSAGVHTHAFVYKLVIAIIVEHY